ncbi:MAG: ABC transporter ATP-binding protein [Dehalococcoidia bacterium]|nr:ABC transporter ATP-binding protein [Dehalococcoidia bacterium]
MFWHTERIKSPTAFSPINLRRVLRFLVPYWRTLAILVSIVGVSATIGVLPPLIVRRIIDNAIGGQDRSLLAWLVLAAVGVTIFVGLLGVLHSYLNTLVSQRIMYDLKVDIYQRLQTLSLKFFTSTKTGEMISRLTSDIGGIDNVISGSLVSLVSNLITLVSTTGVMLALSWQLTALSFIVLPWLILPTLTVGRVRRRLRSQRQQLNASVTAHMQESLGISGFMLIKTFNRERQEVDKFNQENRELMQLHVREALVGRWFFMVLGVVTAGGPALLYWYGGGRVIAGELTIGTVVAFVALLGRLYGPATSVMSLHVDIMTSAAYFERIFQYLDLKPDIADAPGAEELPPVAGRIEFQDVSLEYVPGRKALDGVSLTIEPGQLVALVGPSGAGKTSLTYLALRLYDPTAGRILVDGHDIRAVKLVSLRREIGVVTQETFLFHASIADNLRFAQADATQGELEEACGAAFIHDLITSLPQGYDTVVGERGYRLSGGEKQRLAIARVMLKNPRIFLLDEATSSLDTHSERHIQAALANLIAEKTCIVIAHRLSTVLAADTILYMDGGHILEQGTHEALLLRGGLYARLYEEQLSKSRRGELVGQD